MGIRSRISCLEIKHTAVPHYDGLKVEAMLELAALHPKVMRALPVEERERNKLPRGYIANVLYTFLGDDFKTWVNQRVDARNEHLKEIKD